MCCLHTCSLFNSSDLRGACPALLAHFLPGSPLLPSLVFLHEPVLVRSTVSSSLQGEFPFYYGRTETRTAERLSEPAITRALSRCLIWTLLEGRVRRTRSVGSSFRLHVSRNLYGTQVTVCFRVLIWARRTGILQES